MKTVLGQIDDTGGLSFCVIEADRSAWRKEILIQVTHPDIRKQTIYFQDIFLIKKWNTMLTHRLQMLAETEIEPGPGRFNRVVDLNLNSRRSAPFNFFQTVENRVYLYRPEMIPVRIIEPVQFLQQLKYALADIIERYGHLDYVLKNNLSIYGGRTNKLEAFDVRKSFERKMYLNLTCLVAGHPVSKKITLRTPEEVFEWCDAVETLVSTGEPFDTEINVGPRGRYAGSVIHGIEGTYIGIKNLDTNDLTTRVWLDNSDKLLRATDFFRRQND